MTTLNRLTQSVLPACRASLVVAALSTLFVCSSCERKPADAGRDGAARAAGGNEGLDRGASEEHADEVKLTADAIAREGVSIGEAQLWTLKPSFVVPARVGFNAEAMAHVGSPLRGRAVDISARQGSEVKKGDPLILVESPELGQAQSELLLKRSAVETARPQVELAKAAWDRARGLLEQSQGISLTEVQRREAEYKAALANVKAAESAARASENTLHLLGMTQEGVEQLISSGEVIPRYTIRAPIDGQVVHREITQGELVSPDREALMVLADTSTLWVLADVPEVRLPSVAVGAKAWVSAGASMKARYEGTVSFISPLVDPTTRTAQVRIEVPAGAIPVRPGVFAQVEIVASTLDGSDPAPQVAVPMEAVQTVEGGPAVFVPVEGEENTFQKRAIAIGATVGGLVPVLSGLVEGEKYVIAGSFIMKAELGKGSAAHEH